MLKTAFFLSLMVILSLVLAACGGAEENNQETQTVPTIGVTELPNTGLEGTETTGGLTTTETTGITGTETTGGQTTTETPMVLETSTPSVSVTQAPVTTSTQETGGLVTGTQTAVLPPTGMADPSRLTTLLTFDVRNTNGDVLADVNNMVIDLGSKRILYVLVGSGGFLGIGEKDILVPYEQMQVNPDCISALASMSATGGTSDSTGTPGTTASGTATVGAIGTDTTGITGSGAEAGMDSCFFLLNVDEDTLQNAPNFDRNQMPDINTPGWDAQFMEYWQQNSTSGAGTASGSTSGTGTATVTETPVAGIGSTGTTSGATAQGNNRLILADELLGMNVVAGNAAGSTGGATSGSGTGTSGTGTSTSTETPGTGATSTETPGTGATSTVTVGGGAAGVAAPGDTLGTITDAIVDLQSGMIRYFLVTADMAMGSTLNGRLVPIPPQAFTFAAAGASGNQQLVNLDVNPMTLSQAPAFDEGTFPNASIQGWDTNLNTFWSDQGFSSITNP